MITTVANADCEASPESPSTGSGVYRVGPYTEPFEASGEPVFVQFQGRIVGTLIASTTDINVHIFRWVEDDAALAISSITLSGTNPVRIVTTTNHGLVNNDCAWCWDVGGTVELNEGIYKITKIDDTTFDLQDTKSDLFTAYTSGGSVAKVSSIAYRRDYIRQYKDTTVILNVADDSLTVGKEYVYLGAVRNTDLSLDAYIDDGAMLFAVEYKR